MERIIRRPGHEPASDLWHVNARRHHPREIKLLEIRDQHEPPAWSLVHPHREATALWV
jgi:hypothetical protein